MIGNISVVEILRNEAVNRYRAVKKPSAAEIASGEAVTPVRNRIIRGATLAASLIGGALGCPGMI